MAAGLVAGGAHPSPFPHAHIATTTTHKTLRGPRGAIILTNDPELAKKINSAIFPGLQGGPLMHIIAAKAVAFGEALRPEFKTYARAVVNNAKALGESLKTAGLELDVASRQVRLNGKPLSLTATEFRLLEYLMSRPGVVFSREQLLNSVWGQDKAITDRAVDVTDNSLYVTFIGSDFVTEGKRAAEWLAGVSQAELADVLYRYGEEQRARQIAAAIVRAREAAPITTTRGLADPVAAHAGRQQGRIYPATRVFQAIRIAVNAELAALERALPQAVELLASGGRLVAISFHSLEDRIVKRFMAREARGD